MFTSKSVKNTTLKDNAMLWVIFLILLLMWFAGVVTSYTLGGFIHFLLVFAVLALIYQVTSRRRAV
jgi:hypothetical protein